MSDLTNRLRDQWEPGGDIYEAADLIERQEREIQDRDRVEYALRKEIERLKAAIHSYEANRISQADCNTGY